MYAHFLLLVFFILIIFFHGVHNLTKTFVLRHPNENSNGLISEETMGNGLGQTLLTNFQ